VSVYACIYLCMRVCVCVGVCLSSRFHRCSLVLYTAWKTTGTEGENALEGEEEEDDDDDDEDKVCASLLACLLRFFMSLTGLTDRTHSRIAAPCVGVCLIVAR
jgi:hypothetical protein